MNFFYPILLALLSFGPAALATNEIRNTPAPFDEDSFKEYVSGYEQPQLFQENDQAFAARLKLLDQAPKGSKVKVLTFMFDNGEVTRRLATHLCLAAKRGVKVEFMADSKSGDRPLVKDVFDKDINNRVNEELYLYLANCGVKTMIHNSLENFNTVFGKAVPQVSTVDTTVTTLYRLQQLATSFAKVLEDEFNSPEFQERYKDRKAELKSKKEFLETLKGDMYRLMVAAMVAKNKDKQDVSFWERAMGVVARTPGLRDEKVIEILNDPEKASALFDSTMADVHKKFAQLDFDGADPEKLAVTMDSLKKRFAANPELTEFYHNIRRFNRLNHRKLFQVESPNGQGCTFVGGRNLGDHYLADHHDSFMDGDVLYCRHHGNAGADILDQATASFDELKNSNRDGVLEEDEDSKITEIVPRPGFRFKQLIVPRMIVDPLSNPRTRQEFDSKELAAENRTLLYPRVWEDMKPVKGVDLAETLNWKMHRVAWEGKRENDPVRQALLKGIRNETDEVYIETAYAEFDEEIRNAIVEALERGVNVRLVTNGLFITDGPSKMIRFFMALQLKELQEKFNGKNPGKGVLDLKFATLEGGHMIHFKGSGFKCQKNEQGDVVKTFMIGSHNYHPRSGYSDKEHALQWDQPAGDECLKKHGKPLRNKPDVVDMVDYRDQFYAGRQKGLDRKLASLGALKDIGLGELKVDAECEEEVANVLGLNAEEILAKIQGEAKAYEGQLLAQYPSLRDELQHVINQPTAAPERKRRAALLLTALFDESGKLKGKNIEMFLLFLREGGVRDFLGTVL